MALVAAGVVAGLLLFAPAEASAQFTPTPWGANDQCADVGPKGRGQGQDSRNTINLTVSGAGSVTPHMYNTQARCITPEGAACTGAGCSYEVQTVCEFHCLHDHTAPFHWTVQLVPQETGANFLGWGADCAPIVGTPTNPVPRSTCIVRMNTDQSAIAYFGGEDTQPPSPVSLSGVPGAYNAVLNWTGGTDEWLAGYEIYKNGTLLARAPRGATSYQVENLFCESTHSFQVKAYDQNAESASQVISLTTKSCAKPNTNPRPNTVLHVKPPKSTRSRTAFFHFGTKGSVRASKYQCKLDRGRWATCSGRAGKRYRNVKPGLHTFRVRAGNAAGYDKTPATYTWRVRR